MDYLTSFKTKIFRSVFPLLFICGCIPLMSTPVMSAEDTPETGKEDTQNLTVIEFYTLTNTLPRELIDLQNKVDETKNPATLLTQLPTLAKQIDQVDWDTTMATADPNISYHQLSAMESRLIKIKNRIDQLNAPIESNIRSLESWYRTWLDKEKELHEFMRQVTETPDLNISPLAINSLEVIVNQAKDLIESHIEPSLQAGQSIGELQTRVYAISLTVSGLIDEINEAGIQQTSPSMLSSAFYGRLDVDLVKQGLGNLKLFSRYQWGYLQQSILGVVLCLLGIIILAFLIHLSKMLVNSASRWHSFASRPMATAVLLSGSAFMFYDFRSVVNNMPPDWNTLLLLPLTIATILLTDRISNKLLQPRILMLRVAAAIYAVSTALTVLGIPQPIFYLFIFLVCLGLVVYHLYLIALVRTQKQSNEKLWLLWLGVFFLFVVIVVGAAGYDLFAMAIFSRALSMIVFTTVILLLYYTLMGLIELIFHNSPVAIIRSNSTVMVSEIAPLLILSLGIVWFASILKILWIYPTVHASFTAISSVTFTIGSLTITPGLIMAVVIAGYGTLLFSHAIKAILLQETLPRHNVELGVQLSITRLIHYAILTIGFLIILRILGFGMGQITIIGGALGVGIGFGLQAIVNNFVSGLILLFERPIKVGDVVVVGQDIGEVKEMGLRATTVQTFDNAEIVIPNSELITKNVTNWTLAEKRVRVKIPVGVAYGTNIETVLKILLSCAKENPTVLSTPEPRALFLAFGNSSLDFELRVWISDFNDKLMVLSELNQDIESEFELADIEIPFPQTDLHIRTIDQKVSDALGGTKGVKS